MNTREQIKQIIKELRNRREFKDQKSVAEYLGYHPVYFSRALNSDPIPYDFEELFFSSFPKHKYLYGFEESSDEAHEPRTIFKTKKIKQEVTPIPYENYMMVEFQDLATAAGKLGTVPVEQLPDTKKRLVPKEFDNGKYLVVRVKGSSMDDGSKRSISDGDEILIKELEINNGEKLPIRNNLFVIVSAEGTVLKQIIEQNHEEGYILCHSFNPVETDYKIMFSDIYQIFIFRKIVSKRPEF